MLSPIQTTPKETFTREEVIQIIHNILQNPDEVLDAVQNEHTDWDAEELLLLGEEDL